MPEAKSENNATTTWAAAVAAADQATIAHMASNPIKPRSDNLICRPWGGYGLRDYKNLGADGATPAGAGPWGEAFEICADGTDAEASRYPSIVSLPDGSEIDLPLLLAVGGRHILGDAFVATFGPRLPLLPKTLDVHELLSVQAHPEGNTEAYVILAAEPGATICLGFRRDMDAEQLKRRLATGRLTQQALVDRLLPTAHPAQIQALLAPNFAQREQSCETVVAELSALLAPGKPGGETTASLIASLKQLYWEVLDSVNRFEVEAGQVIYNANPPRIALHTGRPRSAEVHALGNPEGKQILALEIRRPGTTYRAWDHVRFPLRDIHIEKALDALNLMATDPREYFAQPHALAERPGVFRSVEAETFIIDHLRPRPGQSVKQPADGLVRTLHVVRGSVLLESASATAQTPIGRGESALLPASLPDLTVTSDATDAEAILVTIPLPLRS